MNKTIKDILVFVAGAAIGSFVTWEVTKRYYSKIADEEIESVKARYSKRSEAKDISDRPIFTKVEHDEYADLSRVYNHKEEGDAPAMEDDEPYVISPDEFGECTYETITLTYYADGVLADEVDDIVDDVDGTIGRNSLLHFGEYEDECVHVRNDMTETDYEVFLDTRSYWGDIKNVDCQAND